MTWSPSVMREIEAGTHNGIGHGLTQMTISADGRNVFRVKAWRTVDEDGTRRPQYYRSKWDELDARITAQLALYEKAITCFTAEEELELYDGYWQPRLAGDA